MRRNALALPELPNLPSIYQDKSGLWRVRGTAEAAPVPPELVPPTRPVAATPFPTFFDQLFSYTTAAELIDLIVEPELAGYLGGMPSLDGNDLIAILESVPLEPAIRLSVWVQRRLRLEPTNAAKQLETMGMLYGPVFRAAAELLLHEHPRRALFSEQQAFALQRLLLLHAEDRPAEDLTTEEQARLLWAFLWIPDAILDPDLGADATLTGWELADERFLRFFVANGGLAGHAAFKHELARAHALYHVIANSPAARRHPDYCPLDAWLEERYGLGFVGLQTFGFSFFARSNVGDRDGGPLLYANKDYFANTGLAAHYDTAIKAIAAEREWFEAEFSQSKEKPRRAAYELQPFLRRPALLQRDGNAVVLGLRALEGWLSSTGAYYRLLDLARARGDADMERFRRFNGWLQERYVRQLTHIAHPYATRRVLAGSGRVLGEQLYKVKRRGESMTSDVAVDLGLDLVLVEVTTKRVTQRSLVDGDIEAVIADVRAMVIKKMEQLGRVVDDLAIGRAVLPGIAVEFVERVWPLVVVPDGLFHTPTLWAWLNQQSSGCLERAPAARPRIAPLVLLDAEEYEVLMGLVAAGSSLVSILELKTTPLWRERDFKSMHLDCFGREAGQLPFIDQELRRSYQVMRNVLRRPAPDSLPLPADLAA
jgi:hypothetical protein